jgi:predicted dehydrogenase
MQYKKDLRFAIIGCGLAGKKRSAALPDQAPRIACDHDLSRAKEIAQRNHGTRATANTEEAILDPGVQASRKPMSLSETKR